MPLAAWFLARLRQAKAIVMLGVAISCGFPDFAMAAPIPVLKPRQAVSIAMYGDSTMLGTTKQTGVYAVTPRNAVSQLGAMLTAGGYKVKVSNHGVNMIITDDLLNGTRGVARAWVAEMKSNKADIVVINTGLNDAALIRTGWDSVAHVKARMTTLARIALSHGKAVFIETPNPCSDDVTDALVAQLASAAAEIVEENAGTHLIDQYHAIKRGMPDWESHLPDGLHPDDTLYTFKAVVEAQALIPSLPPL
ncbi:MAG: SGNH/GDSL hydrolase family protein [Rhodanobacter sp.]